jgi:dTDP-glucose pyrophosphorylase
VGGSIAVKRVDEPPNYGIVTTDGDRTAKLVEKPDGSPTPFSSGVDAK